MLEPLTAASVVSVSEAVRQRSGALEREVELI